MAASREELVLSAFLQVAADLGRKLPEAVDLVAGLTASGEAQAKAMAQSPVVEAIGSIAKGQAGGLPNWLGMAPLARLVIGLFGGGGEADPAPDLVKFALPGRLRVESAEGPGASLLGADYGQDGLPRAYVPERPSETQRAGPQVTVNVQAMDSRSFLDHKEEIARAVREAMLNSHSLNDVVNEL